VWGSFEAESSGFRGVVLKAINVDYTQTLTYVLRHQNEFNLKNHVYPFGKACKGGASQKIGTLRET